MKKVLAAVLPAARQPIELREIPEPELEQDSALLRTEYSEVCGTDLHLQKGHLAGVPYPLIPGHVSVGVLESIRGTINDIEGRPLAEGDRVTFLDVHRTCHQCWYCLVAKASTRCPKRKVYGITYGLQDGLTGGWAEKIYLKPGTRVLRMEGVPSELFMAGGCALPTAIHAIERAAIELTESVLVLGSGPVGIACGILAKLRGAGRVLMIGAPQARLQAAKAAGIDEALDFTGKSAQEREQWVQRHTQGRGVDVTLEATGVPEAVVQSMRFTRDAGRVVVVGQYTDVGDTAFNPHADINRRHLTIHGCWGSDYSHFHKAVEVMKMPAAQKAWSALSLKRFTLSQANEALAEVAEGRCVKAIMEPRA